MPAWIARRAVPVTWRRIPWKMIWTASVWLAVKGRDRIQNNLTQKEQREFWRIVKGSKGRSSAMSQRDRTRLKNIAAKAVRGS
jgi:hypothetical protein